MKIMQIENGFCHWDATEVVPSLEYAKLHYAPNIHFVEAPDYVFEGWTYVNGEFIQPTPPEGWEYNESNGTFYQPDAQATPQSPLEGLISALVD